MTERLDCQNTGPARNDCTNTCLAIFTSQIGTISETFIRRHIEDLIPERTITVVRNSSAPNARFWRTSCPSLFLDLWEKKLSVRLARRAGVLGSNIRDFVIKRFLRKHGTNVVLGEYLDQFVDFVPLLDRMQIPYIVQGHGIDLSAALRKPGMAERYLEYRSARAILTRCEFHRQRLIAIGLPPKKIFVNPGGVDIPQALGSAEQSAAKRFLAIGRMTPKKGPIYLLEAFRLAALEDRELTLDYIGEGELFSAVRQFVAVFDLSDRVRLHGSAGEETKAALLKKCGVFVQHSITDPDTGDEEGLPAAIQEAMANGLATITTRHAGIPEAVEDGITGWLVNEGDTQGMAQAMLRISSQAGSYLGFGQEARKKAQKFYSWHAERSRLLISSQA